MAGELNNIGDKNTTAVKVLGDSIGLVADLFGAGQAFYWVISKFTTQPDPLQPILDAIRSGFHQLAADLKAQHIIERRTNQVNAIGPARAVLDILDSLVSQQPPLTGPERLEQIQKCITAMEELSPDPLWEAPFNDQIFWTDARLYMYPVFSPFAPLPPTDRGYGEQAPTGDSNAVVFNYFYILPAYLEALFIFLAVAASLFPDFAQRFTDGVLRPAAVLLQTRHDTILSGITPLSPGHWDRQRLLVALAGVFQITTPGITALEIVAPRPGPLLPSDLAALGGVKIEYGAVEKFSGVSSMGDYEITYQMIDAMPASDATEFNKFQIYLEKKAKEVYVKVGLLDVWKTINDLKTMVGDAPLPRPNFADWSFRNLISTAQIPPRQDGFFHLVDLIRFLSPQRTGSTGFRRWLY